jgi:hypothetical protein
MTVSAIDQLVADSQMQHQRYLELYGPDPANGGALEELSTRARQLSHDVVDARGHVVALQFSTAVTAPFASATAGDHQPLTATAQAALAAAKAADTSAQVNRRGAADIAGNAREEASQIEAVPDADSPEGQAAILAIISQHQSNAAQTVTASTAAEQAAGQQAAAGGGPGPTPGAPSPAVPSSPDDVIVGNGNGPHIQMVDHTTPAPQPSPTPQIGPFPVPPQVAQAAGPPPASAAPNPFLNQYQQSLTTSAPPSAGPPMPSYQSPPPPPPPPFGQCVSDKVKPDLGKHMISDGFSSGLAGMLAGATGGAVITPEVGGAGGIPGGVLGFVGGFAKGAFEAPIKETLKGVADCAGERAGF